MWNKLVANFSSLIHASLFLIVCISLSTSPLALSLLLGASIIQNNSYFRESLIDFPQNIMLDPNGWNGVFHYFQLTFSTYKIQNFSTLGPFALSIIHAVGNLEKRTIAAGKYFSCLFLSEVGQLQSICISWFGSAHGIWG